MLRMRIIISLVKWLQPGSTWRVDVMYPDRSEAPPCSLYFFSHTSSRLLAKLLPVPCLQRHPNTTTGVWPQRQLHVTCYTKPVVQCFFALLIVPGLVLASLLLRFDSSSLRFSCAKPARRRLELPAASSQSKASPASAYSTHTCPV